ncbi:Nif3-like dinuclear metal center hexameric protein [Streptococcus ovuberis]|uniref:GTP cyclohydrolase 1 type 2 homolog n=1 Tax=Streptococcus ovuberis TaxID=1936207 RepID=A0A7X6MYA6_9STRE|nr:Nif3-like dinuclear metal center hexameric protein [Streptococcus ovuberis]NKZ20121.1 Nif3-like dinuclear metal center hexameric protein [Streptococcus ovuberis]
MKASQLIERYEAFCPQDLSLEGDVVGLQIGTLDKDITKVLVALDLREQTVCEAVEQGAELIIVKHAPIFRPLKHLMATPQNQMVLDLVKHDIAVYVSHTNIDVVEGGLNDWFCDLLGLSDVDVLSETADGQGIGRVGNIATTSFEDLARKVKETFQLDSVRLVSYNRANPPISRVAICGGSGQSFYKDALKKGADVYITGDIYYHTAQEMLTDGLLAIDPGHHIEILFVSKIAELLNQWITENNWELKVVEAQESTNPFWHL